MEQSDHKCEAELSSSWSCLRSGDLAGSYQILNDCLLTHFDHPDVLTALKYVNFWREREKYLGDHRDVYTKIEYLLQQWPIFLEFQTRNPTNNEECNYGFRFYFFGTVNRMLDQILQKTDILEPALQLRKGICFKGMGEYDQAVQILEQASLEKAEDPDIIAQLADAYALVGETNLSKVFFREAFFIGPNEISYVFLESEMIQRLFKAVQEKVGTDKLFLEWVPVYGELFRVFSVKRELRAVEYGRLRQSVYALERELANQQVSDPTIMPRLLTKYFWIIDHLISIHEEKSRIQEILLKIRSLNSEIHTLYTK